MTVQKLEDFLQLNQSEKETYCMDKKKSSLWKLDELKNQLKH